MAEPTTVSRETRNIGNNPRNICVYYLAITDVVLRGSNDEAQLELMDVT